MQYISSHNETNLPCVFLRKILILLSDDPGPPYDMYGRAHDTLDYISTEHSQAGLGNLPVPVGMFMNMAHVPPRFYQQHQQALAARGGRVGGVGMRGNRAGARKLTKNMGGMGAPQLSQPFSQDPTMQNYSQPGLTQGHLSQVGTTILQRTSSLIRVEHD